MIDLIERIEVNRKEFNKLYKEGVIGYSSMGVQVSDKLFTKLSEGYEIEISDWDDSEYPYLLEVVVGCIEVFTIMTLEEIIDNELTDLLTYWEAIK